MRPRSAAASITRGDRHVPPGDEGEDRERRQAGDAELRQILAEEGLQLLDAVDQRQHDAAGALAREPGGAELGHLVVKPAAQNFLDARGGARARSWCGHARAHPAAGPRRRPLLRAARAPRPPHPRTRARAASRGRRSGRYRRRPRRARPRLVPRAANAHRASSARDACRSTSAPSALTRNTMRYFHRTSHPPSFPRKLVPAKAGAGIHCWSAIELQKCFRPAGR